MKPIVDVIVVTYNQGEFLQNALDSVLSQITSFEFRVIIGDDASQDNTLELLGAYKQKFNNAIKILTNDENRGLVKNYLRCLKYSTADYICFLEGDDYWTDPNKLQKQKEFLDNHERVGLVHSDYFNEVEGKLIGNSKTLKGICIKNQGDIYDVLIKFNIICPLTVMFRSLAIKNIDFALLYSNELATIDYFIWLGISLSYEIKYTPQVSGVYRILGNSVSNNADFNKQLNFIRTKRKIINYYLGVRPSKNISAKTYDHEFYSFLAIKAMKSGNYKQALKYIPEISLKGLINTIYKYYIFNIT